MIAPCMFLLLFCASVSLALVSNPQGYLVGRYTQYAWCAGSTTSMVAQAIGECVYSGLIGYPYPNTYTIYNAPYANGSATFVNAQYYFDNGCTDLMGSMPLQVNACTSVGASVYFSFSQTIPVFSGGYVQQTVFNYTGTATIAHCPNNSMVLSVFNYESGCLYDCGGGSSSCQFQGCASGSTGENGVAIVSQYSQEYCPSADYQYTVSYDSSCQSTITCFPQSNDDDDDDDGLSTSAIVGITFAATFVGTLVLAALASFCYFRYFRPKSTGLTENLVY
jgi:phosphatidylglycerophosphatase A